MKDDLAIEEAADLLNMSRSYLFDLDLIESGALPKYETAELCYDSL